MTPTRGAGGATFKMHLRSRKRTFASAAASTGSEGLPLSSSVQKRVAKPKSAAVRVPASSVGHVVVAPTSATFPVLSAWKERVQKDSNETKVLYTYATLVPARLIRRYKRFLADVVLLHTEQKEGGDVDDSESVDGAELDENDEANAGKDEAVVTVHCPNTGPMIGLLDEPNARVQLSKSSNPKRKYAYTLEMIQIHRHVWVGVHSTSANRMVEHALESRWFPELGAYDSVRREVKFAKNSRVDFVLTTKAVDGSIAHEKYVEVKSVTLALSDDEGSKRCAVFPDTVSTRAQKHVTELTELLSTKISGKEGVTPSSKVSGAIVFLVQRDDCHEFAPSIQHDQKFAELCSLAAKKGVQLLAYACTLEPNEDSSSGRVRLLGPLPLQETSAESLIPVPS
ncbi:hypothetical protein BBJ28_00002275 [Nothophytophthora sp. Chile5]|nr:hypothetical protein BBJ28_00002275 [Nothophytophthora sp. Chile5]